MRLVKKSLKRKLLSELSKYLIFLMSGFKLFNRFEKQFHELLEFYFTRKLNSGQFDRKGGLLKLSGIFYKAQVYSWYYAPVIRIFPGIRLGR